MAILVEELRGITENPIRFNTLPAYERAEAIAKLYPPVDTKKSAFLADEGVRRGITINSMAFWDLPSYQRAAVIEQAYKNL